MNRFWAIMPGVPAAGHVAANGFWHPGLAGNCIKCARTSPFGVTHYLVSPGSARVACGRPVIKNGITLLRSADRTVVTCRRCRDAIARLTSPMV